MVNKPPVKQDTWVRSLGRKDPLERAWQPTPVFLPGEFHGQRSLAGYGPRVAKSQTQLKQLSTHAYILQITGCDSVVIDQQNSFSKVTPFS